MPHLTTSDCLNRCPDGGTKETVEVYAHGAEEARGGGGIVFQTSEPQNRPQIYSGSWHSDINHWGTFIPSQKPCQQKRRAGLNQKHRSWESSPDFRRSRLWEEMPKLVYPLKKETTAARRPLPLVCVAGLVGQGECWTAIPPLPN